MDQMTIFILIGCIGMLTAILLAGRYYGFSTPQNVIITVFLSISGILGTKLLNLIESGRWGGTSFFGCLFFAPIVMIPLARYMHVKVGELLDVCTPAGCMMLIILKVNCLIIGCCQGIVLQNLPDGNVVRFPSQIVEGINGLIMLFLILFYMSKNKYRGILYPWAMIYYGATRFALNLLRDTKPLIWIIPGGNLWGMVSIAIGTTAIIFFRKEMKFYHFMVDVKEKKQKRKKKKKIAPVPNRRAYRKRK